MISYICVHGQCQQVLKFEDSKSNYTYSFLQKSMRFRSGNPQKSNLFARFFRGINWFFREYVSVFVVCFGKSTVTKTTFRFIMSIARKEYDGQYYCLLSHCFEQPTGRLNDPMLIFNALIFSQPEMNIKVPSSRYVSPFHPPTWPFLCIDFQHLCAPLTMPDN